LTVNGNISFSGDLTFSQEFLVIDGVEGAPAYSFASDPTSGMYLAGPGRVGLSAAGVKRLEISSTLITATVPLDAPALHTAQVVATGPSSFADATFSGPISAPVATFGSLGTTPLDATQLVGTISDALLSVNVLRHTAGYPGGIVTFLRADGTFATPTGIAPSAHHTAHEVGGADAITGALEVSSITSPSAQFTSIGTTPLPAANLTGTVLDARLTVNVLKFTGGYPGGATSFLRADGTFSVVTGVTPGVHAATHASAGSDPVAVTGLAGYPGGTATFLRADGTFATPVSVAAAHHTAHEPGGADALVNVAWTNLANTFTLVQTFRGNVVVAPAAGNCMISTDTVDGTDNKVLTLSGAGGAGPTRGAYVNIFGNEYAGSPGDVTMVAGTGRVMLSGSGGLGLTVWPSAGVSVGGAADPGVNNFAVTGNVKAANLKWQQAYTWALQGDVSGLVGGPLGGFIPGLYIPVTGTQTAKVVGLRARIHSGTSVQVDLYKNDVVQASGISVTPTRATTVLNLPVVNEDEFMIHLTNAVGAPSNLNVTIYVEYSL
jgi:hypothetical protein